MSGKSEPEQLHEREQGKKENIQDSVNAQL